MKVVYFAIICHLLLLGSFMPVFGFYPTEQGTEIRGNPTEQVNEIRGIIEGVIGRAACERWAEFLRRIELKTLPPSATIFFPTDVDPSVVHDRWVRQPSIIQSHILPHALTTCQLRQNFRMGMRIPTLMPGHSLLVTSNTGSNFTINGVPITRPQMFFNGAYAVHGVPSLFDNTTQPSTTDPSTQNSDAPHLSAGIAFAFLAVLAVFSV